MKKRVLSLLMIVSLLISMTGTAFATELGSNEKETITLRSKGALVYYEDDGKTESMVFEAADIKTLYDRVEELTEESINTKKAIIDAINDATDSELTGDVSFSDLADKIKGLTGQVKTVIDQLNKLDDFQGKNKIPDDASSEDLASAIAKIGTKYDEIQDTNLSQNGASRFGEVLSAQAKDVLSGKMIYDGKTGAYIAGTMQDYSVSKKVIEYLTSADDTYVIKEGYYDGKIAVAVKGGSWKPSVNIEEYPGRKIGNRGVDAPNNGEVAINAKEQLGNSFLLSEAIVTIPSFDRLSAIPQITLASAGVTEANSYDKDINGNTINYSGYITPAGPENISTGKAAWVNGRLIVGTGQDNKSYMELAAGSGSGSEQPDKDNDTSVSGLSRVECLNMRGDGNKGTVYVVPEDMTDVILVYFGGQKIVPKFQSDEDIAYKEIHYKIASGANYYVACTMYFVTKLKKGTGITNLTGYPYLVRIKESNAKGGNITKETISGKTYFANDTLKDVFLLQSNMATNPVNPVFQEAPDNPIITFKQLATYRHALDNVNTYCFSLYYIPELKKSSAITKHSNGVLFY